ncbi:MAG: glutathione S-transferase family protein [Cyanobacteria bacterium J06648_11]
MLKLYGGQRSRAAIVQWYLEELGVPYEFCSLDMGDRQEHRQPDFLAINPMGKVPAIVDGTYQLWESGAILLYLAEKYDEPEMSVEQRSLYNQWILFANATLGPGIFVEASREKETPRLMTPMNDILARQPFVAGSSFTVADVAVGSILAYIPMLLKLDLGEYPAVERYIKSLADRAAFRKAILKV